MIEFRKGEEWCRWNGILMNPKNHKKLFGVENEVYVEDGWIDADGVIYTDKPIGQILMIFGEKREDPGEYDEVVNQGYGWNDYTWEKQLAGKIIFPISFIENLEVKPMKQFKKDYPKFNQEKHDAFYNELEEFYDEKYK
ncbi:MAG: hypothetical protein J6Y37_14115 [Paludibacteraceae bacterium]|nr:hypothetical protein [Paludibacteraceae bacterium]